MKWVALTAVLIAFPISVLLLGKDYIDWPIPENVPPTLTTTEDTDPELTTGTSLGSQEQGEMDLRAASAATLRKIQEIDKKIESARHDLQKNESARQAVIKDLIKIQAKINSIIKAQSTL